MLVKSGTDSLYAVFMSELYLPRACAREVGWWREEGREGGREGGRGGGMRSRFKLHIDEEDRLDPLIAVGFAKVFDLLLVKRSRALAERASGVERRVEELFQGEVFWFRGQRLGRSVLKGVAL